MTTHSPELLTHIWNSRILFHRSPRYITKICIIFECGKGVKTQEALNFSIIRDNRETLINLNLTEKLGGKWLIFYLFIHLLIGILNLIRVKYSVSLNDATGCNLTLWRTKKELLIKDNQRVYEMRKPWGNVKETSFLGLKKMHHSVRRFPCFNLSSS
jgi:hypothetical protein